MPSLLALTLALLTTPALATDDLDLSRDAPALGDLETRPDKTVFYFDIPNDDGTHIRVLHDGSRLPVEALGPCVLPGDTQTHPCFRAVSARTGLLTLRVDVLKEGQWQAGKEILVGLDAAGATVVAHLPYWEVYTYGTVGESRAVGRGGGWSVCRPGRPLPTHLFCPDGHWAYPINHLIQVQVQHGETPVRRSLIPIAPGVYTFYRSGRTIWGSLKPPP